MTEVFEFIDGNYIYYYELIDDEESPLPNFKKFNLIGKEFIYV